MALGAKERDVLRLVPGRALSLTLAGIAVGAWMVTRLMSTLLFEIDTTDLQTFTTVSVVLAAVSMLASYIPARRASQVDPLLALKTE